MNISREELFCVRLPLLDVRQHVQEDPAVFREFDLYLIRGQVEYLLALAQDLATVLAATPEPPPRP